MADRPPLFQTGRLETDRVEAFSDGVMAVAITLLVLEVKLPPNSAQRPSSGRRSVGCCPRSAPG